MFEESTFNKSVDLLKTYFHKVYIKTCASKDMTEATKNKQVVTKAIVKTQCLY